MADRVGQQLGNYRLTRLLGRGGFADVYLGEHVHIDTLAAIKVLHAQLTSEDVEKFRTEARTLARLVHPQIVRLLDFCIQDNTPFLVMDYAPNGSLRQRYPKGTILPLTTIVPYVTQVAEALQFAHDAGFIHRDIKPENMLLGRQNEILLSDFGIAVLSRTSDTQSIQGMAGTPYYMAPEQFRGKLRRASDQYALGITVYEWLSGYPPFNGTPYELMGQHVQDLPPSLRQKIPTLSPAVEQVVLKALEKDHQKRFESVREFAQALAAAIEQTGLVMPTIAPAIKADTSRGAPPVPQRTKRQWIDEGDAHYDAGRYKEAVAAYSRAIELDPRDADIYFNRGSAYHDLKEYRQAITDYDRAITLNPTYAVIYCSRGNAYHDLKEYRKAIADFDRTIELDPNYAVAYHNQGNAYYALKEYQRAIANFDRAIKLDPRHADPYYSRGNAYYALKEYQRAIANFDRAIALDSKYADSYYKRGLAYRNLKEYQKAITDFDRAIELDVNYASTFCSRGNAYRNLKEYRKAITDFDRAIKLDPNYAVAYYSRGKAYYALEEYRRAITNFDRALGLDPSFSRAKIERAKAYAYNIFQSIVNH